MTVKKKRTQAQIAATKKLVAFNKKRRGTVKKKRVVKKKKAISSPSQITKKAPSARLKRRRKANVKKGYFPNPVFYVGYIEDDNGVKFYYHGWNSAKKHLIFDDNIEGALWYRSRQKAIDEISHIMSKTMKASPALLKKVKATTYRPK